MKYIFIFLVLIIVSITVIGYFQYHNLFIKVDIEERVANLVKADEHNPKELEDDNNYILRNTSRLPYRDCPKIVSLKTEINFFQASINSDKRLKIKQELFPINQI